jgi:tRNA threonylcarbamoyladenosine biosynthesis protein TsaE
VIEADASTVSVRTHGPEETEALAEDLGAVAPSGCVVGLVGPLGAGKTCFVRGLAAGLGVDADEIASPTFVYLVDYPAGQGRRLFHADLYRFADLKPEHREQALASIGLEDTFGPPSVVAVEWWEYYVGLVPECLIRVEFTIETADDRLIFFHFEGPEMAAVARALRARLTDRNVGFGG